MGLFDEESSDDESNLKTTTGAGANGDDDGDEAEDPLDAFMNTLNDEPSKPKSSAVGGRLDMDAEDEATAHWKVEEKSTKASDDSHLLPKYDGCVSNDRRSDAQEEAKMAMDSTFVKAGGRPRKGRNDPGGEFDEPRKCKDMLHEEIGPLEKVEHVNIRYDEFRRKFYSPPDTAAGHRWRQQHDVVCTPSTYDPVLSFGEMSDVFPDELIRTISKEGYDSPTLVQSQTLSVALGGHDGLITAATGGGKTLAYLFPMVVHINDQPHLTPGVDGPIAVVLTPTRELAKQVYRYAKTFVGCIGGKAIEVAGGQKGTWELTKELKKGQEIVISTPGRLIDMVKKKGTNLKRVTFLVLDEADRMLSMGFEKQVTSILENIRPDRQTLLLSATFGKRVEKVARSWLRDPVRIAVGRTGTSSEHVDSHVMVLPDANAKAQWLLEMLPVLAPIGRCIVFVATRDDCESLSGLLSQSPSIASSSASVMSIHGDKSQGERNSAMSRFKRSPTGVLVATDVASRGLDIEGVSVVINYDAAKNIDSHVHRVGRAGRLSKDGGGQQRGVAYTLLTGRDANFAASLADAFEREGREVSLELAALCQKSSRYGGGRSKQRSAGLGFEGEGASSHYGPTSNAPPQKKSRWH